MGTRPPERGFLMSGQVRGEREPLKIIEIERRGGVGRRELAVRLTPQALVERRPRLREYADGPHNLQCGGVHENPATICPFVPFIRCIFGPPVPSP
ncbi:hypothetical protein Prum_071320 [Phytohabitans rumicis]|uniref:Uncharacterized protein n=1 Tax=Phytohabitans rumicis TaxID=1076125 RepID=A0A6V8LCU6_9ACTN|nr:hypothetical protein Prum_071320 [Phytohabitans rumicis]